MMFIFLYIMIKHKIQITPHWFALKVIYELHIVITSKQIGGLVQEIRKSIANAPIKCEKNRLTQKVDPDHNHWHFLKTGKLITYASISIYHRVTP